MFDKRVPVDTTVLHSDAHKKLTLKVAQEGITLLKNDGILPLDLTKIKTLAVIGPNAAEAATGGGGSSFVDPYYSVSPLEGLKKRLGNKVNILYAIGDSFPNARLKAAGSEFFLTPDKKENGLLAEYFDNKDLTGTPALTRVDKQINFGFRSKNPLNKSDFFSIRWTGFLQVKESGDYELSTLSDDGVRLYIDDKIIIDNWTVHGVEVNKSKMTLESGKLYKLKAEYYENDGEAVMRLGLIKKQQESDQIQKAADVASKADVIIIFAGSRSNIESEGRDREGLELPLRQLELINAVLQKNKNVIVVLNGGTPMILEPWLKDVKALVNMYFVGQETGNAIASILAGDVNPSGKLPFSYIANYDQSPAFKGYKDRSLKIHYDEGIFVGYRFLEKEKMKPAFPFGFGLSYTTFKYSNILVNQVNGRNYEVKVDITNTGKMKGDEVVQLYVSDINASVPRPLKELKGFSRVSLNSGETKTVTLKLKDRDFAFWDVASGNWKVEPGDFEILIGNSSEDIKLKEKIVVQ